MKNYITIYSNHVSQQEEVILDGVTVYINPMPKEDVYVVGERLLSYESIFLLTFKRDEFVTGQSWDTLTRIAEEWGLEKTKEILNRLPAELYEMNAQDFIEHFSSDSFGA